MRTVNLVLRVVLACLAASISGMASGLNPESFVVHQDPKASEWCAAKKPGEPRPYAGRASGIVRGRVETFDGKPLASANVAVFEGEINHGQIIFEDSGDVWAKVNAGGEFAVFLPKAAFSQLVVTSAGYLPAQATYSGGTQCVRVLLTPSPSAQPSPRPDSK